jgi:hypothetical protein
VPGRSAGSLAVIDVDLRTLTKLVLKLLGLYFLIVAIGQATNLLFLPTFEWFFLFNVVFYSVLGLACFVFPGVLINRVLRIEGGQIEGTVTAEKMFGVGVALLGLYFAVSGLTAVVFTLAGSRWFYSFTSAFGGARGPDIAPEQFASIVTYSLQLVLGLGLWLGWRHVMRFTGMWNDR